MTDKDAGEAARRIEKAFTTGGAYSGDDPVTVARAYLDANDQITRLVAEIERLRAALNQIGLEATALDATSAELLHEVAAIARAALSPLPAKENPDD